MMVGYTEGNSVARIVGMASAIPVAKKSIFDLGFDEYNMGRISKLSGITEVRYAAEDQTALDFCLASARRLIEELGLPASDIDGIVFATPHPDYVYPGNCSIIQRELGIGKRCFATDINHSCTGFIYGLHIANMLIESRQCRNVLVCCGDTASKHLNPRDRALRSVVGDGGVAALVSDGGNQPMSFAVCNDGVGLEYLYTPAGGERIHIKPGYTDVETVDAEGNIRTMQDELMNGLEVMRFVLNEIPPLVHDVLDQQRWSLDDVDFFSFHQANAFMIKSLSRAVRIKKEKTIFNAGDIGNIGGGSIALTMCREFAERERTDTFKVVMAAFGTGMAGAAMSTDMANTAFLPVIEI